MLCSSLSQLTAVCIVDGGGARSGSAFAVVRARRSGRLASVPSTASVEAQLNRRPSCWPPCGETVARTAALNPGIVGIERRPSSSC